MFGRIRAFLPVGGGLPDAVWEARHKGILLLLWAHAAFIPVFGVVRGYGAMHIVLESAPVPLLAALATWSGLSRGWKRR